MDFELKIMPEKKLRMPDGAKPPGCEDCVHEPELEVPMEVLTKTALETPIPTTPTMKSKLAPNESLGVWRRVRRRVR